MLTRYFRLVVALLVIEGLAGCEGQKKQIEPVADRRISFGDVHLTISPGQIPVETLLRLQLSTELPLQDVTAELSGVSMYMGKIPLHFTLDSATGLWVSNFMLGACSDPKMIWQLQLKLTDNNDHVRQLSTEFQSSWR